MLLCTCFIHVHNNNLRYNRIIITHNGDAETKVSQFGDASGTQEDVFRFDVSVNDIAIVLNEISQEKKYYKNIR